MEKRDAFVLQVRTDNIAVVTIDVPDEKTNTLKADFVSQVRAIVKQLRKASNVQGLIFISGKPDNFIAGADINMIAACQKATEAERLARQGQQIMAEIHSLPIPVVAAIHGSCLGGGLELALACHSRICSDGEKTRLGLPEVQLGLLPGSGGTQRLPRLVGVQRALTMMLTGKSLRPKQALRAGLVDDVVPQTILLETAVKIIHQGRRCSRALPMRERILTGPLSRSLLFSIISRKTEQKTHGHYPAARRIIDVVKIGLKQGISAGLEAEARAFGALVMTPQSKALCGLFFASTALKKEYGSEVAPRSINAVGILGGGLMGGGIAQVTALQANLPVRIKDIDHQGLNRALKYSREALSKKVFRHDITPAQRLRQMTQITGTTNYSGFKKCDIIVEAVFEDLSLKQKMVAEVEHYATPQTIFASNTSSLPIADIAAHATHPECIIGLHYFSPVTKMPLVEVIPHSQTSAQTISTVVSLAKKQGKMPIVVGDRAGFYVNRILTPYINEALRCLMEGEAIEKIDASLVKFGFPVGPIQLLDEVGIDVGTNIIPVLTQALGERFAPPSALEVILQDNRKGRKNARGFYRYSGRSNKAKKQSDKTIYRLLNLSPENRLAPEIIAERCVMMILNEAVRCLDENIIKSVRDGDIGAVFGIGFPPFLGGPFRYMDTCGIPKLVSCLASLAERYGERFLPCVRLVNMAHDEHRFWPFSSSDVDSKSGR